MMFMLLRAYIKADPQEDPEVLNNLIGRLAAQGISAAVTERDRREIFEQHPFLYFRNAYVRIPREYELLKFHHEHPELPYITTSDSEVVSVNPTSKGVAPFILSASSSLYEPQLEPLPILIGTHRRPLYFQLALNSLLHNIKSSRQRLYIILSDPDEESKRIVEQVMRNPPCQVEAVISEVNLRYAFANFGAKFFNLARFVHHEDDGILPENTHYHLPYWTSQLHHRSNTAGVAAFRIFEGNWTTDFWKSSFLYHVDPKPKIPHETLWYYTKPDPRTIIPVGGMGMVINSSTMYRDFKPPSYNASDHTMVLGSKTICIANIPIYHIGANYIMDYPAYAEKKANTSVERFQTGRDLRTGQIKHIDLAVNWDEYKK